MMPTYAMPPVVNQRTLARARQLISLVVFLAALVSPWSSWAQDPLTNQASTPTTNLLTPHDEFLPVREAYQLDYRIVDNQLLLQWNIADGYYLYEERFKFRLGDNTSLTPAYTPGKMKYDELFERETMVHYHQVTASLDLTPFTAPFALKIESQGCADAGLCYPPQTDRLWIDPSAASVHPQEATNTQAVAQTTAPQPSSTTNELPSTDSIWLFQAIALALLGGIILNLMPCVFPVLSIKIMSLATADRRRLATHGWVYTLGIITCFVGFAVALIAARAGGEAIGWGFQLQSPGLIAALAYLFFVMGLSLSGLIHFGAGLMGAGHSLTQRSGLSGSFFTGILAAIVASPCTAPFMGAALGFALTQPAFVCIAIFAALGFGMALPLLLLCYIPALADRLPRPGPWMDNLKHFLAFPLYLTAVWLLWVFGRQTNVSSMAALCAGAVAIAFGCWLLERRTQGWPQVLRRLVIAGAFITAVLLPWQQLHNDKAITDHNRWQAYSPEQLNTLRNEGRAVFINLTADWCITCLANERMALHTQAVEQAFDDHQVATLKGDWTNTDPHITALLQEYGRSGVPLYLWFPANSTGKAHVLPQLLTKDMLIKTIKNGNTP